MATKAPVEKKAPVAKKTRGRRGVKSQAVREYLAANPTVGPTEVVRALAEKGIKVTVTLVSNIKSKSLGKSGKKSGKKRGRPVGSGKRKVVVASGASGSVSFVALKKAKALADELGSIGAAKAALDNLAELR